MLNNREYLGEADFTIERFNPETRAWEFFEHLGVSGDLDWVRKAYRIVYRQDWDSYYRVVSQEVIWFGSSGDPIENTEWSPDRN